MISTVFIGIDHQFADGPPRLFETMIFLGDSRSDVYCRRYPTRDAARDGHARAVDWWQQHRDDVLAGATD